MGDEKIREINRLKDVIKQEAELISELFIDIKKLKEGTVYDELLHVKIALSNLMEDSVELNPEIIKRNSYDVAYHAMGKDIYDKK